MPIGLIRGPLVPQIAIHSRKHSILWRHKMAAWVDFGPQGSGKRHPIRAQTSALRAQCNPLWSANHWFSLGELIIPCFEHDGGGRGAVRRAENAPRDTSPGVEHRRAAEVKRFLKSLVTSHEPLARCMLIRLGSARISARAGFAPEIEEFAARAARDAKLHHKVKK